MSIRKLLETVCIQCRQDKSIRKLLKTVCIQWSQDKSIRKLLETVCIQCRQDKSIRKLLKTVCIQCRQDKSIRKLLETVCIQCRQDKSIRKLLETVCIQCRQDKSIRKLLETVCIQLLNTPLYKSKDDTGLILRKMIFVFIRCILGRYLAAVFTLFLNFSDNNNKAIPQIQSQTPTRASWILSNKNSLYIRQNIYLGNKTKIVRLIRRNLMTHEKLIRGVHAVYQMNKNTSWGKMIPSYFINGFKCCILSLVILGCL
jgi:hypothetical protein